MSNQFKLNRLRIMMRCFPWSPQTIGEHWVAQRYRKDTLKMVKELGREGVRIWNTTCPKTETLKMDFLAKEIIC